MPYPIAGYDYTWWRGDELPALPALAGFKVEPTLDRQLLADLHHLNIQTIAARIRAGSQPYVAFLHETPVAYGWSATKTAGIEEVGLEWPLSPADRNLWDFVTLEAWRGRGIYPQLLQAILRLEVNEAQRFWIGHRADNNASKRGILKAGFQLSALVVIAANGQPKAVARGNRTRSFASPFGKYLGFIDVSDEELTVFDFDTIDGRSTGPASR